MKKKLGVFSLAVSVLLAFLIGLAWSNENKSYNPNQNELLNLGAVGSYLENANVDMEKTSDSNIGVYIDSLRFETSNDVLISGYVWQTMTKQTAQTYSFGIIFPESVGGTSMEERYSKEDDTSITKGWYFETVLRQKFDYSKYPLDHKTIWVRILPEDFSSDIIFVPDLDSYKATGYYDSFGVSDEIVFSGWELTETFFDYHITDFDTSFGLGDDFARKAHPELSYNIVIERDFKQAIMVNLTLMLIIMILLYSLVLMITTEEEKMLDKFGMSASGAIGTSSALFFSVLLAHIDLRNMFGGQFVYLEIFYYVAYFYILAVSILIYVFLNELKNNEHVLVKSNAKIVKLLYWPIYFGIIYLFTLLWMR